LKNYFERNGLVVDKEVRDAFANNIPKAVVDVWDELHQTKPEWSGADVVRKIPLDLIPHSNHESVREEMGKGEKVERTRRRRSSATVIVDALVIA